MKREGSFKHLTGNFLTWVKLIYVSYSMGALQTCILHHGIIVHACNILGHTADMLSFR